MFVCFLLSRFLTYENVNLETINLPLRICWPMPDCLNPIVHHIKKYVGAWPLERSLIPERIYTRERCTSGPAKKKRTWACACLLQASFRAPSHRWSILPFIMGEQILACNPGWDSLLATWGSGLGPKAREVHLHPLKSAIAKSRRYPFFFFSWKAYLHEREVPKKIDPVILKHCCVGADQQRSGQLWTWAETSSTKRQAIA